MTLKAKIVTPNLFLPLFFLIFWEILYYIHGDRGLIRKCGLQDREAQVQG